MVVDDGRAYVDRADAGRFDYVLLDAFNSAQYIPPQLVTREFFESVRRVLKPEGRLIINLIAVPSGTRAGLFRALSATLWEVFIDVRASQSEGETIRNIMLVASQDDLSDLPYGLAPKDGTLLTDELNPVEIFLERANAGELHFRRVLE